MLLIAKVDKKIKISNSHLTSCSSKIMITEEEAPTASPSIFNKTDLTLPAATCSGQVIRWLRPS